MLPDWERNWGLPDPLFLFMTAATSAAGTQTLMRKMTIEGGQSRAFFIEVASDLGLFNYDPRIFAFHGRHLAGRRSARRRTATRDGKSDRRKIVFTGASSVADISLTWFRVTVGQAAIDPHLRIGYPTDLECLLNRWKPAHTMIVFDFSGISADERSYGRNTVEELK